MQALTPLGMDLNALIRTASTSGLNVNPTRYHPKPGKQIIQCVSQYNPANTKTSSSLYLEPSHVALQEWLSPCTILSSKSLISKQTPIHTSDQISAVNHNLITQSPPHKIADLSPAPTHGAPLRVAYQGAPGAYSESAASKAYLNCETLPCDQFEVAFQAVEHWVADRAVLPVENSLGGSIHRNYDLLLRHRLHIVGEVQIPVHHCLLALPGVRPHSLTRVISHPQALAQCEHTLTKLALNVAREAVDDTAGAAEYIASNNLRDTAAIASSRAADLYGLEVIADGIQDDSGNMTRFVMLAREPIIPRTDRPFKTSIVFAQEEEGGMAVLFKVLAAFALRDINLTKIESRPNRARSVRVADGGGEGTAVRRFEYMFYVDFEASMAEARAQNAVAEVEEYTSFLRVLGSYPMDMTPWTLSSSSD